MTATTAAVAATARIPGVVDGTVTPTVDDEGNLCLHIEVRHGPGRSEGGDSIEIVLTGADARALLSARTPTGSQVFPCSVGVRLQAGPSLSSSLQESSCP
ncbi:hypothetical protein [Streptomyces showdoensis]|uniref:Uncharacterized protein n=1 Tax=Streptomyces showdoensis TaxID=68268 RepID=A0A2P2GH31_STREW|nr:hypothetical protein [Streptomyces showdoensis]KKZ70169.1 hypothetical protein VO63_30305 [Streptomyces showdoensis]